MARWSLDTCTSTVYIVYFLIFFSHSSFSLTLFILILFISHFFLFSLFSPAYLLTAQRRTIHSLIFGLELGVESLIDTGFASSILHLFHEPRLAGHVACKASARPDTLRGQSTQHNTAHTEGLARGVFDDGIYADPLANGMSTGEVRIAHRMRARVGVYT